MRRDARCAVSTGTARPGQTRGAARSASVPWPARSRPRGARCASPVRCQDGRRPQARAPSHSAPLRFRSCAPRSVGRDRKQRHRAGALDRVLQLALMKGTGSGNAAWQNLSALRDELLQHLHVLEVDVLELLDAELADAFPAIEELLLSALLSAARSFATVTAAALPRS